MIHISRYSKAADGVHASTTYNQNRNTGIGGYSKEDVYILSGTGVSGYSKRATKAHASMMYFINSKWVRALQTTIPIVIYAYGYDPCTYMLYRGYPI